MFVIEALGERRLSYQAYNCDPVEIVIFCTNVTTDTSAYLDVCTILAVDAGGELRFFLVKLTIETLQNIYTLVPSVPLDTLSSFRIFYNAYH